MVSPRRIPGSPDGHSQEQLNAFEKIPDDPALICVHLWFSAVA
jgi:hypothetical protein